MVQFLNDDVEFEGKVTTKSELVANGTLTVGPGGLGVGETIAGVDFWPGQTRVQVADVTERAAVVAWRAANTPISASNPLLVWRANGSQTGVNEITLDGVNWYAESPLSGDIEMTIATAAPYGWLLMQGQLLANAAIDYPALWAAASTALRVGGSLRIPDMRGRAPIGAGTGTGLTLRNLGDHAGAEAVAITEAQLAAHDHSGETEQPDRSLSHQHILYFEHEGGNDLSGNDNTYEMHNNGATVHAHYTGSPIPSDGSAGAALVHRHDFTTDSVGSNEAHPNMQPSLVLNFKVKV